MARLTDHELPFKGKAVVVKNVENLVIYQGKLNTRLSAPCDNWFEDDDPPRSVPKGTIAVRQLKTGCLAILVEDQSKREDIIGDLVFFGALSFFDY